MEKCKKVYHVYIWNSKRGEREIRGHKNIFEEIMAEIFPKSVKGKLRDSEISVSPKQAC